MTKTIPRFQELIKGRQHNRMLRLSFPHRNAPDAQMVVDSIDAVESISRDFEYKVKLLSDDPCIALKDMQGKLLNIELVRADGSLRYFSGYVFSFRRCHADGGIALYEATLAAIKTQADDIGGRKIAADHAFPELSAPHLVMASPAGIASTTAGSTHLASDGHTVISTGKTISLASGEGFFASVRKTLRLLVHQAGMKLVAAAGDIDVQALNDSIRLLAKLKISQTANEITITAQERIVINGGGSYANFSAGGIELGTNGGFVVHAASDDFNSPKNMDAKLVIPTHGGFDNEGAFLFSA